MAIEPNERVEGPGFIWIKTKTSAQVAVLLLERFPALKDLAATSGMPLEDEEPFVAYELSGTDICRRLGEREYLASVGLFINELAESRDPLIGDVLVTGLLENVAQESVAVDVLSEFAIDTVKDLIREIEEKFYGRFR